MSKPATPSLRLRLIDHLLYWLAFIFSTAIVMFGIRLVSQNPFALADASVIACELPISCIIFMAIPYLAYIMLPLSLILAYCFRYPILGRKNHPFTEDIFYASKYKAELPIIRYPLLHSTVGLPKPQQQAVREQRREILHYAAILLLSIPLFFCGLTVRTCLHEDGSVSRYLFANIRAATYAAEDIDQITFSLQRPQNFKSTSDLSFDVYLTYSNQKSFRFSANQFIQIDKMPHADLVHMHNLKQHVSPEKISFDVSSKEALSEYAKTRNFSTDETAALLDLFDMSAANQP